VSLKSPTSRRQRSWGRWVGVLLGVAVAGVGFWLIRGRAQSKEVGSGPAEQTSDASVPTVKVIRPRAGGIVRTIQQPAVMHAFESVDMYAMISRYLKSQTVDIGSRIQNVKVLAEINAPGT
jgi:HlyD family secretion protein